VQERCRSTIEISRAVLKGNSTLSGSALRVYIYLCSLFTGLPVTIGASAIARATNLSRRTIFTALNALQRETLIHRESGRDRETNTYRIFFGDGPLGTSSKTENLPVSPPTISAQSEVRNEYSVQQSLPPPLSLESIDKLAAKAYRALTPNELVALQDMLPADELKCALSRLLEAGGIDKGMPLDFFRAYILEFHFHIPDERA
jgi:hypothetical protein